MNPKEAYAEALCRIREAEETGAQELDLSELPLDRLPRELARLASLQELNIYGCGELSDLSPLAGLTSLQGLYLSECKQLSDLSPLASLTSLQWLILRRCRRLTDLSPLAGITSLTDAFLDTFSFQARPFYEKLGYRVFGMLENHPAGHQHYFMTKQL